MRYEKGHKDQTREQIIEVAASSFRASGVQGVGVAKLMSEAGLTHGGFYAHFASKEELLREAIKSAFDQVRDDLQTAANKSSDGIEAITGTYLSRNHLDHPQRGCAAATLASEVTRHSTDTRTVFNGEMKIMLSLIEDNLISIAPEQRQNRAVAIFSLMMGAIQLARLETSSANATKILDAATDAVLALSR